MEIINTKSYITIAAFARLLGEDFVLRGVPIKDETISAYWNELKGLPQIHLAVKSLKNKTFGRNNDRPPTALDIKKAHQDILMLKSQRPQETLRLTGDTNIGKVSKGMIACDLVAWFQCHHKDVWNALDSNQIVPPIDYLKLKSEERKGYIQQYYIFEIAGMRKLKRPKEVSGFSTIGEIL